MIRLQNGLRRPLGWLLLVCLLSLAGCARAERPPAASVPPPSEAQLQKLQQLNQTAEEMYAKAMQGDYAGARGALQRMSDQVPQIHFEGITSVEGIKALADALTEAKRVFNAVQFQPEAAAVVAAKLRMAADALTHTNQPLWLQYYSVLQADMDRLEKAAKEKNKKELQAAAGQLAAHYDWVRPSLIISRAASDVEKTDSLIAFIKTQTTNDESYKSVLNAAGPLRQMLDKLFMKKETTAYLPYVEQQNPILWTLVLGSIIMSALSFAGWRLAKKDGGLVPIRRTDDFQ